MIRFFRYVPHRLIAQYESAGWTVFAALGPVHGAWSCLMQGPEVEG